MIGPETPPRDRWVLAGGAAAGGLSVLALPPLPAGWLAWVALIPFFIVLPRTRRSGTVALAVAYAITLGVGNVAPWLAPAAAAYFGLDPARALALTLIALAVVSALHGVVLGVALLVRPGRPGMGDVLWCAAVWAGWESIRTSVFPYYPAAVLGLSQYATPIVLQAAGITGVAGVSFIIVAANAAVAHVLRRPAAPARARLAAVAAGCVPVAVALGWGALRLRPPGTAAPDGPRVAAVDVHAMRRASDTLAPHLAASAEAVRDRPALVVWPESALAGYVERDRQLWTALDTFVRTHGTPLLAGGPGIAYRSVGPPARFNSAHLLAPGRGLVSYHKRRLVPFAEHWPAALGQPPPGIDSLDPGRSLPLFPLPGTPFGVLICFEITDAAGARALARAGARFLINLTNDIWFAGSHGAPHLPWAAVRAVETGLPVLRAANAGESALFDRFGRRVVASRAAGGPGVLSVAVPAASATPYSRHGSALLVGSLAVAAATAAGGRMRARPRTREPSGTRSTPWRGRS